MRSVEPTAPSSLDSYAREHRILRSGRHVMTLDHSVYPDIDNPPDDLPTPEDKAEYVHRICSAFDFGIFPERDD
jgi:hypothetical protein